MSRIDHLEHPSAGISLLKKGPKGQGINNRENPPADGCSRWMDQYMTFTRTVCRLALASPSLNNLSLLYQRKRDRKEKEKADIRRSRRAGERHVSNRKSHESVNE